ncbi:MAG: hypothetical protein P0Y65_17125 [Candidatus Devosia phytovorans]|uniref:Uncharacterized protein n=1 Tax=Candidatus Devosia phytovorans TaxID=3121372 RepID=A0AAJ6B070_9HYPH|nr:hypothetical protein [Devosia sp.]WEK03894.1 MAG: hypothetical protein P0Y65_17125 [Devosia sp.]
MKDITPRITPSSADAWHANFGAALARWASRQSEMTTRHLVSQKRKGPKVVDNPKRIGMMGFVEARKVS